MESFGFTSRVTVLLEREKKYCNLYWWLLSNYNGGRFNLQAQQNAVGKRWRSEASPGLCQPRPPAVAQRFHGRQLRLLQGLCSRRLWRGDDGVDRQGGHCAESVFCLTNENCCYLC